MSHVHGVHNVHVCQSTMELLSHLIIGPLSYSLTVSMSKILTGLQPRRNILPEGKNPGMTRNGHAKQERKPAQHIAKSAALYVVSEAVMKLTFKKYR